MPGKPAPPPEIPEVPKVPRSQGLGAMVENSLVRFLTKVLNNARETISGMIRFGLDTFLEGIEPFLIRAYKPLLTMVQDIDGCPPELSSLIDESLSGEAQAGAALVGMLGQSVGGAMIGGVLSVALAPMTMYLNARVRPQRPDLRTALALKFRGLLTKGEFDEVMGETGWPVHYADRTEGVLRPRLDIPAMASNAFRTGAQLETLRVELEKRGYIKTDIDAMFEVLRPIPGPGDLVRFALREAWRDDVASKYGYDADWVPEFGEWMGKQGYDPEWARKYWRSHWLVPSVGQAFEMLHRGVIGDTELDDLLKVQDIPSGWRSKLTQIAYTPLGRIDTRWAFEDGFLNEDQIFERFKMQGYNDPDATLMTKVTVSRALSESKGLTRAAVEKAYKKRRLSRGEASEMLGILASRQRSPGSTSIKSIKISKSPSSTLGSRRSRNFTQTGRSTKTRYSSGWDRLAWHLPRSRQTSNCGALTDRRRFVARLGRTLTSFSCRASLAWTNTDDECRISNIPIPTSACTSLRWRSSVKKTRKR